MAKTPAHEADRVLADARQSLALQRAGGRPQSAETRSIGRRSRELKNRHFLGRIWRMMLGVVGVIVAAMIAGLVLGGIGFSGLFFTALAALLVAVLLLRYPRLTVPTRQQLAQGSLKTIVGNTELWLEAQRPTLPAPAVRVIDQLGVQLDALGLQLAHMGDDEPAAPEIRKLVGEHLPDLVTSYTAIPANLRSQPRGGSTPDDHLTDSLLRISEEIESLTHHLADGQIDDLAIKARYLDYRYGAALTDQDSG
ncbi:MAG: hypothetical protein V4579_13230 [Pseudomonadota bacterium]